MAPHKRGLARFARELLLRLSILGRVGGLGRVVVVVVVVAALGVGELVALDGRERAPHARAQLVGVFAASTCTALGRPFCDHRDDDRTFAVESAVVLALLLLWGVLYGRRDHDA